MLLLPPINVIRAAIFAYVLQLNSLPASGLGSHPFMEKSAHENYFKDKPY